MKKKLIAAALLSALGLTVSAAEARDFGHRDRGYTQVRHDGFRHGHRMRHHFQHRHHFHRGHR